jgi:hypothetical protein
MFGVRTWAVYAVILALIALPIWALSNASGAIEEQTWLLVAIAYVLVVVAIVAIRIYVRLGDLIEAVSGQGSRTAEPSERPSLPPAAYVPPSVYAPHPEYDPPPPAVGRRPAR